MRSWSNHDFRKYIFPLIFHKYISTHIPHLLLLRSSLQVRPSKGWPERRDELFEHHINLVKCDKHTYVISYYYNCLQKCWKVIVSPYQRGEVGGKVAVHTFPNLADCLYLHLKKNHRVLKQSTCK